VHRFSDIQQLALEHLAVIEGKEEIRLQRADLPDDFRRIRVVRRNRRMPCSAASSATLSNQMVSFGLSR